MEVVKPLPSNLTDQMEYPLGLQENFTTGDMIDLIYEFYDLVDDLNDDRADAKELTSGPDSD